MFCEGHVPTGAPFVGNVEPEMLIVPHAVRVICPSADADSPDAEPVGRTSPRPFVQITSPEYDRAVIVPPLRFGLPVLKSPIAWMFA